MISQMYFNIMLGLADKDGGEVISSPIPDSVSKIVREPIGVCGQITPWNYPLLQASWKIAPALAAGNTIVLKPSEITPLTTIKVFQLIEEARYSERGRQSRAGAGRFCRRRAGEKPRRRFGLFYGRN